MLFVKESMKTTLTAGITLAFGCCVTLAGIHPAASQHAMKPKKPMTGSAAQIAHGKAVAESSGCNGCHAATYAGKPKFSPSIRANGITAKYTSAKFVRLMKTGMTEDGGHVMKPMPVYAQMPAKDSAALYAFLKSQK